VHHGDTFGAATGPVTIDMAKVRQRKRDMVDRLIATHLENYRARVAELIMGDGKFVAPKTLDVRLNHGGARVLTGEQVFLNAGTHPAIPDVAGLNAAGLLTDIEALELDYLPAHLIVLGGGYVGLELAQAYRRFGSRMTIIEHGPQFAGRENRTWRKRPGVSSATKASAFLSRRSCSVCGADLGRMSHLLCGRPRVSGPSRAATSWPRQDAFPTPRGSGST
jgi:pyruvate/2-oxoglutarate dehydrogenase complex dihydrolipoamide dehydrogenase (E3) component